MGRKTVLDCCQAVYFQRKATKSRRCHKTGRDKKELQLTGDKV